MAKKLDRRWTVHLLHHTHVDIGYTHPQEAVLRRQFAHLERAMTLCEAGRAYPEEARFRWNPEVTWAVSAWLRRASAADRERFSALVREGLIGLDALYGNMLTGLCRPEELLDALAGKAELEALTGAPIDSAMITDVPGWNWGLVTALAESGVRYLSAGTNRGDRIGSILDKWGDKPFYWLSPSGRERVLVLVHGKGYSWFHGLNLLPGREGLESDNPPNRLTPRRIRAYLGELERSGYPFDSVIVRYNIGADNGPPDPALGARIREWNAACDDVRLVSSTTSRAMRVFEEAHGAALPEFRGDLTGYWEDGAASTARETALAREASERISQAADLYALRGAAWGARDGAADGAGEGGAGGAGNGAADGAGDGEARRTGEWAAGGAGCEGQRFERRLRAAAEEALLFDEHTWGAWNSMSMPDSPFARRQWEWKRRRAQEAAAAADDLLGERAAPPSYAELLGDGGRALARAPLSSRERVFTVYNTHSWPACAVVSVLAAGDAAYASDGRELACQRLSSGRLAVRLESLPPFGRETIRVAEPSPGTPSGRISGGRGTGIAEAAAITLCDGVYRLESAGTLVEVDAASGAVKGIRAGGAPLAGADFNRHCRVRGRSPAGLVPGGPSPATVSVLDPGPLVATLRIESNAGGSGRLVTELSMRAGSGRIHISNRLERPRVRRKEALLFKFDSGFPGARIRYDCAFGSAELEVDQLPGACRNYVTASRWLDLSGEGRGFTMALLDAPLFQAGKIRTDAKRVGWLEHVEHSGTVYSYVMNNYWGTNYKADQPGPALFRYVVSPHGPFDEAEACRFALEEAQPPIALEGEAPTLPFTLPTPDGAVLVTSLRTRGGSLEARLYNAGDREAPVDLGETGIQAGWRGFRVLSPGKEGRLKDGRIILAARETILLGVARNPGLAAPPGFVL